MSKKSLHLTKFLLVLLCLFPLYSYAATVCDVDEFLVKSYLEWDSTKSTEVPQKMMEFLKDHSDGIAAEECDENRKTNLIRKVNSLVSFEYYERSGLNEEEYAVLDVLLDYVWSKYNSLYSYNHKEEIRNKDIKGNDVLIYFVSELSGIGYDVLISVAKGGSIAGLAAEKSASWAYLWVRKDNPFPHWESGDFDYSWIIQKKDIVKDAFPESQYAKILDVLISNEFAERAREADRKRINFHFGIGLLFGRNFAKSEMGEFANDWAFSACSARLQIYRVVFVPQLDVSPNLTVGFDLLGGYAVLDNEKYGIDILGGVGYTEAKAEDPDDPDGDPLESDFGNVAFGVQVMKRFSMGDMYDFVPKIQYLFKYGPYENPATGQTGHGISQYLYIGIAIDGKAPMGKPRE